MSNATAAAAAPTSPSQSFNEPVAELTDGGMKIAIWRNEPSEEGGRVRYDHRFSFRYFNKQAQEWRDAKYTSGDENLRAANLYQQAYNKELELRAADRAAAKAAPANG